MRTTWRGGKNATIVACDVQNPSDNVFAGCMGTATVREGFDICC